MRLQSVDGIGPATAATLETAGIATAEALAEADVASLAAEVDLTDDRLEALVERARAALEADAAEREAGSREVDAHLEGLDDWRGETLARVRALIRQADPDVVEAVKWRKPSNPSGVPTWSHDGLVCTGETYRETVKLTFASGAALEDPTGLFNASLGGGTRRAIDLHEGDALDEAAFVALVRGAVAHNTAGADRGPAATDGGEPPGDGDEPTLLAGGNPQIPKGDGDAPVQAYLAAMPGWKRDVGRSLDDLVERTVPDVRKAVRWNSPFYGVEGRGWFLSLHCYTHYVKVTFLNGASLDPLPPGESKQERVRYLDVREDDPLDEALLADWLRQAAEQPGEDLF